MPQVVVYAHNAKSILTNQQNFGIIKAAEGRVEPRFYDKGVKTYEDSHDPLPRGILLCGDVFCVNFHEMCKYTCKIFKTVV